MTLRQALVVLRRGWLVILAAVVVSMLAAGYYLYKQPITYSATATVYFPQSTAPGQNTVPPGTIVLNVTSDATSRIAAKSLHRTDPSALASSVTAGYDSVQSVVSVTATEPDPMSSQQVATAFAKAYVTSTTEEQNANLARLEALLSRAISRVEQLSIESAKNPKNTALTQQLQILQQTETAIASQVGQAGLIQPPSLDRSASRGTPNTQSKSLILSLALVVGLLIGVGVLLIRAPFDTRLRTAADTERLTGFPVLAELPFTPAYRKGSTALAVVDNPRSSFAESVRELRTSTQVLLGEATSAAIVMTSPAPFDGKTLITANMAASWALSGKQTVLVAGDMRRPRIHEFFGLSEPEKGVADLLELPEPTREDVAALLRTTDVPGLMFLSAGKPVGDPADLLASRRMADVTDHLCALADIVIVDAPPVLAAADASIIGSHADGTILVIRAAQSKDKGVAETVKRLTAARVTVLGVAFNRVKVITGSAYRRYYSESDQPTGRGLLKWLGRGRRNGDRATLPILSSSGPARPLRPAGVEGGLSQAFTRQPDGDRQVLRARPDDAASASRADQKRDAHSPAPANRPKRPARRPQPPQLGHPQPPHPQPPDSQPPESQPPESQPPE